MTLLRLMVLMGMSLATLPCDWCQNNVAMPLGSPGGGDHFRISQMEEEMVDLGDDGDVSTLIQDLIVLASKRIQILQPLEQIDPDVINRFVNNEAILEHLSAESKELIRDLLAKDLANWNIFKSFRRTSLQVVRDKNDLDPVLVNVLSFVAPILGNLSAKCRKQTRIWLQRLVTLQKGDPLWPIKFLDFSGKIPTGIFADVIKFGEMAVPFGNHIAFGSYEGCLGIHETDDETNITIDGRSTMLRLTTELDVGVSNDEALEQLLNDLAEADLSNVQSGNTLNVAHAIRARELRDKYLWDQVGIVQLVVGIMGMRWGLCTPSGCSVEDITQSFNALLENFKVANVSLAVAADSSHTKNSIEQVYDAGTIIFILILSILGLLILATTALDVYSKLKPFPSDDDDRTTLVQIIKCFSLDANGRKVLSSKAGGSNHLGCLGGIRTLSMLWVILAHTFLGPIMLMPALVNRFYAYQLIWTYFGWSMELISNAAPSVDTFFLMSGTLVSYLTFIQLERKQFSLWMYYIHRYIRLTIPYAFCIGLAIWIFPLVSFGPFAHVFDATFTSHCRDNWYLNLLYVNNFFEEERMCLAVSWYMANDMQFYWVAPLIIFPIWWNAKLGVAFAIACLVGVTSGMAHIVVANDVAPSNAWFLEGIRGEFKTPIDFYFKPYCRFQPYLIGILLGYVLYKTRGKKLNIPGGLNAMLWMASVATGLIVVLGTYPMKINGYSVFDSVMYNCFHKVAWSIALAWIIFSCVHSHGGVVDNFLSWGAFASLSRLTYMAYLLHYNLLGLFFTSLTYSYEATVLQNVFQFFGIATTSCGLAFISTLVFESPFIGLEKIILGRMAVGSKDTPVTDSNGHERPVEGTMHS